MDYSIIPTQADIDAFFETNPTAKQTVQFITLQRMHRELLDKLAGAEARAELVPTPEVNVSGQ